MASIDSSHVDKVYTGEIKAVDDFTLNIADREFIVFAPTRGCWERYRARSEMLSFSTRLFRISTPSFASRCGRRSSDCTWKRGDQ
jgi:hypothetical protein